MRTIKAYSKATITLSTKTMHGGTYTRDKGNGEVLYVITDISDDDVIKVAQAKCKALGLELWKVFVVGSEPTSFNTTATWCESELYRDDTKALYYEGHFDGDGNRIDE